MPPQTRDEGRALNCDRGIRRLPLGYSLLPPLQLETVSRITLQFSFGGGPASREITRTVAQILQKWRKAAVSGTNLGLEIGEFRPLFANPKYPRLPTGYRFVARLEMKSRRSPSLLECRPVPRNSRRGSCLQFRQGPNSNSNARRLCCALDHLTGRWVSDQRSRFSGGYLAQRDLQQPGQCKFSDAARMDRS
jgi:hypothetical protein